ncbi:MAG: lysostaphin resistance A-like protein [Clostridia bacterium]
MQVRLGLQPELHPQKERARTWAVLLFVAYLLQLVVEWSMIRLTQDESGRWIASTAENPDGWVGAFLLISLLFGLVCSIGFVWTFMRRRRQWNAYGSVQELNGTDFVYMIAWLQVLLTIQYFVYGLFLPFPAFAEGSAAGMLESASFQICIMLVALFLFKGRWAELGFTKPKHVGRMIAMLLVLFGFIIFALDLLVTTPLSDLLDLSLASEREQQIESEILQAKASDWLNGLMSVVMTGIFVPIAEEVLFRGVIQTYLVRRWGAFLGILVSSIWFASVHIDVALFVPLFTISVAIGYMRHRFDSIWPAILLHSMNNLASVAFYFI